MSLVTASIHGMAAEVELVGEKAQRIVAAMRAAVAERGIAGATFDHVARAAGVSRGLLHYYFGTKERLLVEALRRECDQRVDQLRAALAPAATVDAVLHELLRSLEDMVEREPDFTLMFFEVSGAARRNEELATALAGLGGRLRGALGALLETKQREGVLELKGSGESVASVLLALGDGVALQMLADPRRDWSDTIATAMSCARSMLAPS